MCIYTTRKKFRITYYIIFVLAILNPCSYFELYGNCMKFSQHFQWACDSTSTHFPDDVTVILENRKISVFLLIKAKHFNICDLKTFSENQ